MECWALGLMAIRQARLEPLALSVTGHERVANGCAAASGEEKFDLPEAIARFGDILSMEGPIVEIGPCSVFANSVVGVWQSPAGEDLRTT